MVLLLFWALVGAQANDPCFQEPIFPVVLNDNTVNDDPNRVKYVESIANLYLFDETNGSFTYYFFAVVSDTHGSDHNGNTANSKTLIRKAHVYDATASPVDDQRIVIQGCSMLPEEPAFIKIYSNSTTSLVYFICNSPDGRKMMLFNALDLTQTYDEKIHTIAETGVINTGRLLQQDTNFILHSNQVSVGGYSYPQLFFATDQIPDSDYPDYRRFRLFEIGLDVDNTLYTVGSKQILDVDTDLDEVEDLMFRLPKDETRRKILLSEVQYTIDTFGDDQQELAIVTYAHQVLEPNTFVPVVGLVRKDEYYGSYEHWPYVIHQLSNFIIQSVNLYHPLLWYNYPDFQIGMVAVYGGNDVQVFQFSFNLQLFVKFRAPFTRVAQLEQSGDMTNPPVLTYADLPWNFKVYSSHVFYENDIATQYISMFVLDLATSTEKFLQLTIPDGSYDMTVKYIELTHTDESAVITATLLGYGEHFYAKEVSEIYSEPSVNYCPSLNSARFTVQSFSQKKSMVFFVENDLEEPLPSCYEGLQWVTYDQTITITETEAQTDVEFADYFDYLAYIDGFELDLFFDLSAFTSSFFESLIPTNYFEKISWCSTNLDILSTCMPQNPVATVIDILDGVVTYTYETFFDFAFYGADTLCSTCASTWEYDVYLDWTDSTNTVLFDQNSVSINYDVINQGGGVSPTLNFDFSQLNREIDTEQNFNILLQRKNSKDTCMVLESTLNITSNTQVMQTITEQTLSCSDFPEPTVSLIDFQEEYIFEFLEANQTKTLKFQVEVDFQWDTSVNSNIVANLQCENRTYTLEPKNNQNSDFFSISDSGYVTMNPLSAELEGIQEFTLSVILDAYPESVHEFTYSLVIIAPQIEEEPESLEGDADQSNSTSSSNETQSTNSTTVTDMDDCVANETNIDKIGKDQTQNNGCVRKPKPIELETSREFVAGLTKVFVPVDLEYKRPSREKLKAQIEEINTFGTVQFQTNKKIKQLQTLNDQILSERIWVAHPFYPDEVLYKPRLEIIAVNVQDLSVDQKYDFSKEHGLKKSRLLQSGETLSSYIDEEEKERLKLKWSWAKEKQSIEDMNRFGIQMEFEHPSLISKKGEKDVLIVIFWDQRVFEAEDGDQLDWPLQITRPLAPQVSQTVAKTVISQATAVQTSSVALSSSVAALNFWLNFAMNQLLSVLNSLQLILHLPMFHLTYPGAVYLFNGFLISIAKFDLIDLADPFAEFFDIGDQDPLTPQLDELDYGYTSFVANTANLLVLFLLILIQAILISPLMFFGRMYGFAVCKKLSKDLSKKIYWNAFILYFFETSLELIICAVIEFMTYKDIEDKTWGHNISMIIAILFLLALAYLLIFTRVDLRRNYKVLEEENFKEKYEELYVGLNLKEGHESSLLNTEFFIYRRVIFSCALILNSKHVWFQQVFLVISTYLIMFILINFKPYKNPNDTRTQLFNEMCLLAILYQSLAFTDLMESATFKDRMGYLVIAITCLNLAVLLSIAVYLTVKGVIKTLKQFAQKRKVRDQQARLQKLQTEQQKILAHVRKQQGLDIRGEEEKVPEPIFGIHAKRRLKMNQSIGIQEEHDVTVELGIGQRDYPVKEEMSRTVIEIDSIDELKEIDDMFQTKQAQQSGDEVKKLYKAESHFFGGLVPTDLKSIDEVIGEEEEVKESEPKLQDIKLNKWGSNQQPQSSNHQKPFADIRLLGRKHWK